MGKIRLTVDWMVRTLREADTDSEPTVAKRRAIGSEMALCLPTLFGNSRGVLADAQGAVA